MACRWLPKSGVSLHESHGRRCPASFSFASRPAKSWKNEVGKVAIAPLRGRRREKGRDFASPGSPASPVVLTVCQKTLCVGDAKCAAALGSRHRIGVRVTSLSLFAGRTVFRGCP
jgi:hypothetical protein